ncbi:MAG: IPT/TIG domain-containing protein [Bacteroidota bacterium]
MKITKSISIAFILVFTFGSCSSDQETIIEPTPEQEGPGETVQTSLDSIRPLNGPKGTLVTFYGKNFGTSETDVTVHINEKEMSVVSVEDDKIQIKVLPATFSGEIELTVRDFVSDSEVFDYELTAEVTTVAGSSEGHTDGVGPEAQFDTPRGLAMDAEGVVYIADSGNSAIRKMTLEGVVTKHAGGGCSFINGTLETAKFCQPYGVFMDSEGALFVADSSNDAIRKIDINGNVFIAMHKFQDEKGEPDEMKAPLDYVKDSKGNSYVVDHNNHRILKRHVDGYVQAFGSIDHGDEDGTGEAVKFNLPRGLAIDHQDNVYVADAGNDKIRKITPDGIVSTYAGDVEGDMEGPKEVAEFSSPRSIAIDAQGSLYITDTSNNKIKKITPKGKVITLAGSDEGNNDGIGTDSQFNSPQGIVVNPEGTLLYLADSYNHRIRKITLD